HTRFSRDWSSDVCSSDLRRDRDPRPRLLVRTSDFRLRGDELGGSVPSHDPRGLVERAVSEPDIPLVDEKKKVRQRLDVAPELRRSEERRVGKGGRGRGWW